MEMWEKKGILFNLDLKLGVDLDMGLELRETTFYGKSFYSNEYEASGQSWSLSLECYLFSLYMMMADRYKRI